jgi:hypothetical protein
VEAAGPSASRVYDYYLGGAGNLKVDRDFARRVLTALPEAREFARLNRAFLRRAVRYCARRGIRQFLDLGSGIPTVGHTHEVAQAVDPACRVVYVDTEPVAVARGELLLAEDDRAGVVDADLRDPQAVLEHPVTRRLIDFEAPVAVLMVALLHFWSDDEDPGDLVKRYRTALAPHSALVLSHATADHEPPQLASRVRDAAALYRSSRLPVHLRGAAEVTDLLAGFDLAPPGVVLTSQWRPEEPAGITVPERSLALAAVGLLRY